MTKRHMGMIEIQNPNDEQLSAWVGHMVYDGYREEFIVQLYEFGAGKGRPPNTIYWPDDWPDLDYWSPE